MERRSDSKSEICRIDRSRWRISCDSRVERGRKSGGAQRRARERERGRFLCGLDRDELECSNVREIANPHLPFPRARA